MSECRALPAPACRLVCSALGPDRTAEAPPVTPQVSRERLSVLTATVTPFLAAPRHRRAPVAGRPASGLTTSCARARAPRSACGPARGASSAAGSRGPSRLRGDAGTVWGGCSAAGGQQGASGSDLAARVLPGAGVRTCGRRGTLRSFCSIAAQRGVLFFRHAPLARSAPSRQAGVQSARPAPDAGVREGCEVRCGRPSPHAAGSGSAGGCCRCHHGAEGNGGARRFRVLCSLLKRRSGSHLSV